MKKKSSSGHDAVSKGLIAECYFSMLDTIVNVIPGNVYWKDKNGVYLGCNKDMLKIANVKKIKGKTDFDLPWKEEALTIQKTDEEVINSNKTIELEETLNLANGQRAIMLTKKTPLHDQEGNVVAVLGVSFDISKQERKENKAQQSSDIVLNSIISGLPGHVYWKDRNGVYLGCNKRQAKSLGFESSSEVIGKTDFDLPWKKKDASLFRQNDLKIMETGQAETVEETAQMDGRDVIVLSQKAPLRNELGEVTGIFGISLDITSRKMNEENNRQEKENAEFALAYIIEHLPGHVYWKNKDSVYQGCNLAQAKSAGFSEISEMIGKTDYEMPWSNEADILRQSDLMVMSTREELTREEISKIANSEEVSTFLSRKVPFINKKGDVIGILGISLDITDRKKIEAALQQAMIASEAASRAKSEFIANMSHDFITPLTGIINMSADLEEQQSTPDNKQRAKWLNESGEQLLDLCTGILQSVSADNYTEQDLNEECFVLKQLIEAIEQFEKPMIQSKGLEFKIDIDGDIPSYLVADRVKLHRVFINLLGNAIKFTQTGYVGIRINLLEKNNEQVVLNMGVFDTGKGIAPDLQKKIFERFFRVNPSYRGTDKGYGIGLHIAKKYVHLLGAKDGIQLESEEGKGSYFHFVLSFKIGNAKDAIQIAPEENQSTQVVKKINHIKESQPSSSLQQEETLPSNSPLLLLIEDTKPALLGLESIVKRAGCRFKSAEDGEKGLELAKNNDFDLIITDIGLPGISGIEVTKQIRDWEKATYRKKVPIVALTAHAARMAEPECLEAGMDKVFTKPANLDMVKNLIQQFISKNKDTDSNITQQSIPLKKGEPISPKTGLGIDLPDTEEELFILDQYLYLDPKVLKEIYGENYYDIIKESLVSMPDQILKDKEEIMDAFKANDWDKVEKLAHRTKGGASCCGTLRMKYACQYLERYRKAGHSKSLEKLYYQLMQVMDETKEYIEKWLKMIKEV